MSSAAASYLAPRSFKTHSWWATRPTAMSWAVRCNTPRRAAPHRTSAGLLAKRRKRRKRLSRMGKGGTGGHVLPSFLFYTAAL